MTPKTAGILLVLIILVIGIYVAVTGLGSTGKRSSADLADLLELKDQGIGYLENSKFDEAREAFRQVQKLAPRDPLGWTNMAICELFYLDLQIKLQKNSSISPAERAEIIAGLLKQAKASVDDLLLHHDTGPSQWIAAKMYRIAETAGAFDRDQLNEQISSHLRRSIELSPDETHSRYALYDHITNFQGDTTSSEAFDVLQAAYEKDKSNLALLTHLMRAAVIRKSASSIQLLKDAKPLLRSIQTMGAIRGGTDVIQLIDETIAACEKEDWNTAVGVVSGLTNILRSDDFVKSDLTRCDPHPLDLVIHDFMEGTYSKYRPLVPKSEDLAIEWKQLREPISGNWSDLRLVDFDLDDQLDLLALTSGSIEWFRNNDGQWVSGGKMAIPKGLERLMEADLYNIDLQTEAPLRVFTQKELDSRAPGINKRHILYPGVIAYGSSGVVILKSRQNEDEKTPPFVVVKQAKAFESIKSVTHVEPVDLDHDGDLDLIVAAETGIAIWSNRGNMTFADITSLSELPSDFPVSSMTIADWDRDGDIDVIIAGSKGCQLLENMRHAQLRSRELSSLPAVSDIEVTELDGNVSWDLIELGESSQATLTANSRPGVTKSIHTDSLEVNGKRLLLRDLDNDAYPDILVFDDKATKVFRNVVGTLEPKSEYASGLPSGSTREDAADLNKDGTIDLVMITDKGIETFSNSGSGRNWLQVRAVGDSDTKTGKVNHYAIGSMLELSTGGKYQAQVIRRQTTQFGLGQAESADYMRMLMTNGIPQGVVRPSANMVLSEPQLLKGSCPFIYTWDGKQFQFFTDCLWAAPIGLQSSEGKLAPTRSWEYIKIPGERMVATDGRYRLMLTEELWEAAYFDRVQLIAIDHPADVAVYSNEKVGPPDITQFKIHTVSNARHPARIRDQHGTDLSQVLGKQDGQFAQPFERRLKQGLTPPHFIEVDLGKLNDVDVKNITLFLTGWIHPTDTSLNVALSQNPTVALPRLPLILTPDAKGEWKEAIGFMGFPGGKTKTIAVDLTGIFHSADYRLRVASTAEVYWDHIFFTVNEPNVETKLTRLDPQFAKLEYRGFSKMMPRKTNQPHVYDASSISKIPQWPPMKGNFTRYGNVIDLLKKQDAMSVIMSSGDAMIVEFESLPPPAEGSKRDFLLYSVGWDKDADLNTSFGQTVEPLPFAEMKKYPYAPEQSYPQTEAHQAYLRDYQTRQQESNAFWKLLKFQEIGE